LANVVRRSARGERIKVTRYGKTLAVLISKRDLQALEDCEKSRSVRSARRPAARK
jgi:prevent-host-death family protein